MSGNMNEGRMDQLYRLRPRALWLAFKSEPAYFWMLCFYLFLEYVRPQTIYPAIDVIPYAQLAITTTAVLYLLNARRAPTKSPANILMGLFLITILISSAFAYVPGEAFRSLHVFFAWFIVYYLIINVVNTEKRFFVFLFLYILWNFKMTQHGFLSWASRGFGYEGWGVTGAPGWFHNSGEFGIQLSMFIPLSIYFVWALQHYWGFIKTALLLLLPVTALGSVVATNSRGALLAVAAAACWMVLKSNRKIAAVVLALAASLVVYLNIPEQSLARLQASGADYTSHTRMQRWKDGISIMNDHPLFGVGYGNWMRYYSENYPPFVGVEPWGLPHNIFIDAGAELGYTGLTLFVLMMLYVFMTNHRTRKLALLIDNRFIYYMTHALDAGMVGFIVSGSFVSVLFYPYFWVALAFTVALNNVAVNAVNAVRTGSPVRQRPMRLRRHAATEVVQTDTGFGRATPGPALSGQE